MTTTEKILLIGGGAWLLWWLWQQNQSQAGAAVTLPAPTNTPLDKTVSNEDTAVTVATNVQNPTGAVVVTPAPTTVYNAAYFALQSENKIAVPSAYSGSSSTPGFVRGIKRNEIPILN